TEANMCVAVSQSTRLCSMSTVSQAKPARARKRAAVMLPRDSQVPKEGLPACRACLTGFFRMVLHYKRNTKTRNTKERRREGVFFLRVFVFRVFVFLFFPALQIAIFHERETKRRLRSILIMAAGGEFAAGFAARGETPVGA